MKIYYNSVGYNTVNVKGGQMNLLTVSFEAIGNANGNATLNDVMDSSSLTSYKDDFVTAGDYVQTWDMEKGNWGAKYFYMDLGAIDPTLADTWVDDLFTPNDVELAPGSSFWLYANADIPALQFAGQVTATSSGYTLTGGTMNLCGNPYPTSLNLNDKNQVVITGMTSYKDDFVTAGDYVQTWDLTKGNWGAKYFYMDLGSIDASLADTWVNDQFTPAETDIQPSAGFWYYAIGDGVTFTFPAK